jgi:hypothetical protein
LEEGIGEVEREGAAIALARTAFKVGQEPADVGEQQIADLRFLVKRGLDLFIAPLCIR